MLEDLAVNPSSHCGEARVKIDSSSPTTHKEKPLSTPNLLDSVLIVKENERVASASYADAAQHIHNPMGKMLFEQLSDFEKFHYDQLTRLENSLEQSGDYINYTGKEFPQPPLFEIKAAQEPNTKNIVSIISGAIKLEKLVEKSYTELATQVMEQKGHDMFNQLTEEEHKHYRILMDVYWNLNNLGTWKW